MLKRVSILCAELAAFLIMVVAGVLLWASYYIDTQDFRLQFASFVENTIGQPVSLDGELNIALYPSLSLEINDLTLDGPREFGEHPLVSFNKLLVSVRLMPLLSRQVDVSSIIVEGMVVNIIRSKEDTFNWQPVFEKQSQSVATGFNAGDQIEGISLSEFEVVDASVNYSDNIEKQDLTLSGISLRTGAIVPGQKIPFTASSRFSWKTGGVNSEFILKGIVELADDGIKLHDSNIYATLGGEFLPKGANPAELTAKAVVDMGTKSVSLDALKIRFLGLMAEGAVKSGNLSEELTANGKVTLHEFKPADIISRYAPNAPVDKVAGLHKGSLRTEFVVSEEGVSLSKLKVVLDDLAVSGSVGMTGYQKPQFAFDLQGGMVDLDRYIPLFKTGTPFIWDDFNLPLFKLFKGKGRIHATGFKVLDIPISDIKLNLDATDKGIRADAIAFRNGQGSIKANTHIVIGEQAKTGIPTFGSSLNVTMSSGKEGFDFFNTAPLKISGVSALKASIQVPQMSCPPKIESLGILENVSADIALNIGKGKGQWSKAKSPSLELSYSVADISLKASPLAVSGAPLYGYNIDSSVRLHTDERIRAASLTATGPLVVNIDSGELTSSGLNAKASIAGTLITNQQARASVGGKIGFDTAKGMMKVDSAIIRALETTVKGNALITDLKSNFKAKGDIEIPNANVRRIVYLLNKFRLRTGDPEALKHIALKTNFTANKDGFHLDELNGSLDGMPIKGAITGKGWGDTQFVGSLAGGVLDIDRFIPDSTERKRQAERQGKVYKAAAVELPLAFFRWLNVNLKVWLEGLKLVDIRAENVSGNIQAHNGAINVANVRGVSNDGTVKAGWTGEVGETSLKTHLKILGEKIDAGSLLKDMAGRDYIRGKSDIDIDVNSFGLTDDNIVENLAGKVRIRTTNGSFKFTGYDVKATASDDDSSRMLVAKSDPRTRRTVFQKAVAYFTVDKGVFTVDKFRVEAPPLLQSYGEGNFSLPANTIDLTIRNDFVAVPSVRMHLQGKLSDPEVKIPKTEIVTDTVRNILSIPEKSFKFLRDLF